MFGRFKKPTTIYLPSADIVAIAGDGIIGAANVGDGRMIPVLILDTSNRADIEDYIRVHATSPPGDVRVQWAYMPDREMVVLMLTVERPLVMKMLIGFQLSDNHGILVEQILKVRGLYLQAGRGGDRLRTTFDRHRVVVEVPDTGFRPTWDKIFLKHTVSVLRHRGLPRSRAKIAARDAIDMMRETGSFRLPQE